MSRLPSDSLLALLALVAAAGLSHPSAALAGPSVTVYSRDLGFVRETRTLDLRAAHDTIRLADISERLDFSSLRLVPARGARVTRLAYRFDVASGDLALERGRGSRVNVTLRGDRQVTGTLVASDGSWIIVREDQGSLHTLSRASVDDVRLANPDPDFSVRPTIEAAVEGSGRGRVSAELSYLTGGLSWSAEHSLVRTGERAAVWSAAVTVQNTTGRDFVDADLKLVAGEPNRAFPPPMPMEMRGMAMQEAKLADGAANLSEQAFSEYHLYTLPRPATLRDRESQQLTMLEPRTVTISPRYVYRGGDQAVRAQIEVENSKGAGLGVPLPGGRVRIYEDDAGGDPQFTGESRISHTAEGEKLKLDVGAAFDLVAERRELFNRRISDHERQYGVEIKLRNRKKNDVAIVLEEPAPGDVEIIQKSHNFTHKDSNTLEVTVTVPAGKEVVVSYTARVRY